MANSMRCWALYLSVVFSLVRPTSSYGGPFHRAAALGHVTEVQRFVVESWQGKADINAKGDDEWTPLHFTAWKAHLEVCETLLQRPPPFGANVAAVTDYGGTALHLCAYGTPATEERLNVCRFLLDKAASVNAATKDGTTPIYLAALKANIHVLRLLLERGADVNALSLHRASVLQAACKGGNVDIVRDLLKHDVKVKHKDAFGMTALHTAARANISAAIAEVLVDNGAAVDARDDGESTTPRCAQHARCRPPAGRTSLSVALPMHRSVSTCQFMRGQGLGFFHLKGVLAPLRWCDAAVLGGDDGACGHMQALTQAWREA